MPPLHPGKVKEGGSKKQDNKASPGSFSLAHCRVIDTVRRKLTEAAEVTLTSTVSILG